MLCNFKSNSKERRTVKFTKIFADKITFSLTDSRIAISVNMPSATQIEQQDWPCVKSALELTDTSLTMSWPIPLFFY